MSSAPAIGIDLGTTFSGAAVYRNGKAEIIPNKEGRRLTPSLVFYHPESLNVSVGTTAYDLGPKKIENFLFDVKRIIGRKYDDIYVQKLRNSQNFRYNIVRGEGDKAVIALQHNNVLVQKSPEQASFEILKYIRESANEFLGEEVTEAVISVPAHFSNAQRKATRASAELAGLKVLKLLTEPVAAAIHYAEDKEDKTKIDGTSLVFDFGGGTLDVSAIKMDGQSFEVKSIEGDTFLGGRDFDDVLVEHFRAAFVKEFSQSMINDRLLRRIKDSCTWLKIKLSTEEEYSLPMYCIGGKEDSSFNLNMSRKEFEKLTQDLYDRAMGLMTTAIKEAGLCEGDIKEVILVGGTTRIPKVRRMLVSYFGAEKIKTDLNPDEAVALGAAIQAAVLKEKCQELEKYKVTEIAPLSLGLSCCGGLMSVLIKKNTALPTKPCKRIYISTENNQKGVQFSIYEGQRKNCEYNNLLGSFTIEDLPLRREGDVTFEVVFSLNEDGILEVEGYEVLTGKKNKLVLCMGEYRLCDHKIRESVDNAEKNKQDDDIFETFIVYRNKVRKICNHILYDLDKIEASNRENTQKECEKFKRAIETLKYTKIDKLRRQYEQFKKSVKHSVTGTIEVVFTDDESSSDDEESTFVQEVVDRFSVILSQPN